MLISPRYVDALGWAASLHQGQRRLGKDVPYLAHVMAVSSLVWEDGGDEDQAIAGLLHDAIEDAGQNHRSIAERYGTAVADIVQDCTDPGKVPGSGLTCSWFRCKQRLIEALDHQPDTSLLVIAADKATTPATTCSTASGTPATGNAPGPGWRPPPGTSRSCTGNCGAGCPRAARWNSSARPWRGCWSCRSSVCSFREGKTRSTGRLRSRSARP